MTSAGSMLVSKVSLRKSTVRVTYVSELRSRSAIWLADERADRDHEDQQDRHHAGEDQPRGRAAPPTPSGESIDAWLDRQRQEQRHQQDDAAGRSACRTARGPPARGAHPTRTRRRPATPSGASVPTGRARRRRRARCRRALTVLTDRTSRASVVSHGVRERRREVAPGADDHPIQAEPSGHRGAARRRARRRPRPSARPARRRHPAPAATRLRDRPSGRRGRPARHRAGTAARSSRTAASAAGRRSRSGSGTRTAARPDRGARPPGRTG